MMTGQGFSSGGLKMSARRMVPSLIGIGTSQLIRILSRTSVSTSRRAASAMDSPPPANVGHASKHDRSQLIEARQSHDQSLGKSGLQKHRKTDVSHSVSAGPARKSMFAGTAHP